MKITISRDLVPFKRRRNSLADYGLALACAYLTIYGLALLYGGWNQGMEIKLLSAVAIVTLVNALAAVAFFTDLFRGKP